MVVGVGPEDLGVGEFLGELIGVIWWADEVGAALYDIGLSGDFRGVFNNVVFRKETDVGDVVIFDYGGYWVIILVWFKGWEIIIHQGVFESIDEVGGLFLLLFGAV